MSHMREQGAEAGVARVLEPAPAVPIVRPDTRILAFLALGHMVVDMSQGSLAPLLPFLKTRFALSYTAAGAILLVANLTSSLVQPRWKTRRWPKCGQRDSRCSATSSTSTPASPRAATSSPPSSSASYSSAYPPTNSLRTKRVCGERMTAQAAGAFDHDPRALADEMGEIVITDRFEAERRNRMVQAFDEIGMGIEKRSVEIEDDKRLMSGGRGQGFAS